MVRGERLIELGDSWFSAKTIEVVRSQFRGVRVKRIFMVKYDRSKGGERP